MLVVVVAVVHQHAVLLRRAENYGHIRFRLHPKRLHFDEAVVVEESERRQILAALSGVAGIAFAHVVGGGGDGLEADAELALVVLAGRRLRVHHRDHWRAFAELARELARTLAVVGVDSVHADTAVLAHVILAVVYVLRAISAAEAWLALARVVRVVIHAFRSVFAGVEVGAAKLDFLLAKFAGKTSEAIARVSLNAIDASSIVLAFVGLAVIDVDFTSCAFVAIKAVTAKASLLEDTAATIVPARIAVASIDHILAVLAVVARGAATLVLLLRLQDTLAVVFAREREASVAFRQNLVTDFLLAEELIRGRRENELVLHALRLGTASDTGLDVIQFYPFREPFERAIAV